MDNETERKLFLQLILQNQQMALISMGKISNPVSKQVEKNMEYAKVSINTLEMLLLKTKGNLSSVEEQYLTNMISQLKIDYTSASGENQARSDLEKDENSGS